LNLLASMRYLVALNEHRHFGRAALACHITQPALSNALRALEQEFGVVIVQRGRNYAGLTHEGERVLATAHRMLRDHEVLQQELDSGADRPQGTLRLGAVPTALPIVARFAAMLQATHPGVLPVVRSMSSPDIESELEAFRIDIGVGYTDRLGERGLHLDALPQYTERYYFVQRGLPAGVQHAGPWMRRADDWQSESVAAEAHACSDAATLVLMSAGRIEDAATPQPPPAIPAGATSISWREAAEYPLCLLTAENHNRTIVDSAFAIAGVEVKPAIETNSILTLALSVAAGRVCTVLPGALVSAMSGHGLRAIRLVHPDVQTPIGLMVQSGVRPSRVLDAALTLAKADPWLLCAARHSGDFGQARTS
jgi:DNA-binding transcriptional LysR family regulator